MGGRLSASEVCGQNHGKRVEKGLGRAIGIVRQLGSTTFVNSPPRGLDESQTHKVTKVVAGRPGDLIEAPETSAGGAGAGSAARGSARQVGRDA